MRAGLSFALAALAGAAALAVTAACHPVAATDGAPSPRPALTVTLVSPVAADWPQVIEGGPGGCDPN